MRLSTSSSNAKIPIATPDAGTHTAATPPALRHAPPGGPWGIVWGTAVAMAIALLFLTESRLRNAGHVASVVDDEMLWAVERDKINNSAGRKPLALLGNSRMQLGFVPCAFNAGYPLHQAVMLAVHARNPWAAIADLAQDEAFNGIALVFLTEDDFLPHARQGQHSYVKTYHQNRSWRGLNNRMNRRLSAEKQSRLLLANPQYNPVFMLQNLYVAGRFPAPLAVTMNANRALLGDYSKIANLDVGNLQRVADQNSLDSVCPDVWLRHAWDIQPLADEIRQRGGRLVLFRPITSGDLLQAQKRLYPRAQYWDVLADALDVEMIHFKDIPSMLQYDLPDLSHLDQRDAVRFTIDLADELRRRGIIER